MQSFYKTTAKDYGDPWKVTESKQPKVNEVPTYKEIGDKALEVRKANKLLKNHMVAMKYSQQDVEELDEISAAKRKFDQNAIVAKKFPVKPENYKIPAHGLKIGNPLYMTTYMDVGRLKPSAYEINERYHPLNNVFTKNFTGGNVRNTSLTTAKTFSKVHNAMDSVFS